MWCGVVCHDEVSGVYVCRFDVSVHHHHSLLHSCSLIQLSLLNTCTSIIMYKGVCAIQQTYVNLLYIIVTRM